jgi:hypothetical protein
MADPIRLISNGCEESDSSNRTPAFYGSYMNVEELAKRTRDAWLEAVLQASEDAGIQGLWAEGRWEAVVDALWTIELARLERTV